MRGMRLRHGSRETARHSANAMKSGFDGGNGGCAADKENCRGMT